MGLPLNGLLLISLLVLPVLSRQNYQRPVLNSPKGFDKQYKNVFKAYEKTAYSSKSHREENEQQFEARFHTFAIPEDWFTNVFGPYQGPKFATAFRERFEDFEFSTIHEFNTVELHAASIRNSAQVKTTESATNPSLRWLTPTSAVPLPTVQRFRVRYITGPNFVVSETGCIGIIAPGYSREEVTSFIYVDGAFRFIGRGACPFWSSCSTVK
jgi:hypothetical protein